MASRTGDPKKDQQRAKTDAQTAKRTGDGGYSAAKERNPNLDKLTRERNRLRDAGKKGTPEYNAVQNKINAAYGKGPTNRPETPKTEGPAKRGEDMKAASKGKTATNVSSGSSSSKAKLQTGVGSAAKAAAEAASKPAEKAKAVKKPSGGSRRAANKAYRQSMRAEKSRRRADKFKPGGKKYVSSDRLEREASRGPAGEARVKLYEEKRKRQAERRERRANIRDAKAAGSRAKAAAKAQNGGKVKKYLVGGLVAGALAKKALKGTAMGDKIGQTKVGGMLGFEKGGKVVAQGATKKDVRRQKRQARKSGRRS